ncbi:hypothetical protein [Aneurinibacillus tyrosinisolvens]|uniref:hypothetical protein n=1 Tax=Aneurinibacillus tyrosinisolvens TaxID=1443435 RepID=UPI00063F94E1|nr:hypothetical protein [Aneurinibacillus tyrosinisolvens]
MGKRAIFTSLATVAILSMSLNTVSATSTQSSTLSIEQTIPKTMPPGTTLTYDKNGKMVVQSPKLEGVKSGAKKNKVPDISQDKILQLEAKEKEILKEMEQARASLPVYHLDDPVLPKPQPGMTVLYDGMGYPTKVVDANGNPISEKSATGINIMSDAGVGTYTYGASNNKITISSTNVLGEGTVTWYDGVGGKGYDQTILTEEDCATKQSIDNPPKATEINVRNLENNIAGIVYKYDVGSLPNAIIDIMPNKMSFYFETTIGTYPTPYGSFTGRYFHYR